MRILHDAQQAADWLKERVLPGHGQLRSDSRQIRPGDAFLAWPGAAQDARRFVRQALADGAVACLVESEQESEAAPASVLDGLDDDRVASLPGLKAAAGAVAASWFGHPTQQLPVLAVTGTNGKTSTAWWLAQALNACGQRCGVIGTLGVGVPPDVKSTGLTTPDPVTLQAAFADFKRQGFAACAIEASSIGIAEERLAGTGIVVVLLTNFTQDHLDYHGSMAAYWAAKRRLFDWPGLQAMVINVDDPQGALLAQEFAAREVTQQPSLWTVSAHGPARLRASGVHYADAGLAFDVLEGGQRVSLRSTLIGDYNVHNLLVVLGGLRALGLTLVQAAAAVPALQPVPGRMQRVPASAGKQPQPDVVVDYAHTPDALDKVLQSLRPLAAARGGALWCVFGCGGDRDPVKRPLMGEIAARLADHVIITSDNPRTESPEAIVQQILAGSAPLAHTSVQAPVRTPFRARVQVEVDRRQAIRQAIERAAAADVVLIAGKGHEDYQDIAGTRLPFSDAQEAHRAREERAA